MILVNASNKILCLHLTKFVPDSQNVAKSVCTFLADLLPPTVRDDYSLGLLRDLGGVASSMIAAGIPSRELFESLCEFLAQFIIAHGQAIDRGTEAMLRASTGFATEREIFRITEGLFLSAIEYARPTLGECWTRPTEQGQGQTPFESHEASSTSKLSESTKDCLVALLPLIQVCLDHSPAFLVYLPARPGVDREQDMLLRRAVDSTVGSLNEADADLTSSAIMLLEIMVSFELAAPFPLQVDWSSQLFVQLKQHSSQNDEIRSLIADELSRVRGDVLNRLIMGCCGNYELKVIEKVASYFHTLLRTSPSAELESDMARALRQEHFVLGEEAARVCMNVFAQCARRSLGQDELKVFLEQVWTIHRAEDRNALSQSDSVAHLIKSYRAQHT